MGSYGHIERTVLMPTPTVPVRTKRRENATKGGKTSSASQPYRFLYFRTQPSRLETALQKATESDQVTALETPSEPGQPVFSRSQSCTRRTNACACVYWEARPSVARRRGRLLHLVQPHTLWTPVPFNGARVEAKRRQGHLSAPPRYLKLDDRPRRHPPRQEHVRVVVNGAATPHKRHPAAVAVDFEPPVARPRQPPVALLVDACGEAHPKVVPVGLVRRRHLGRPPVRAVGGHHRAVGNDALARRNDGLRPVVLVPDEGRPRGRGRWHFGPPARPHLVIPHGGGRDLDNIGARRRVPRLVRGARGHAGGGGERRRGGSDGERHRPGGDGVGGKRRAGGKGRGGGNQGGDRCDDRASHGEGRGLREEEAELPIEGRPGEAGTRGALGGSGYSPGWSWRWLSVSEVGSSRQ